RAAARTGAAAGRRARARTPPAPAARSGKRTNRTARARPCPATSRPASWGGLSGHDADVVEKNFAEEDHPGCAGERPGEKNERQGEFREPGFLIPAEIHQFGAPIEAHYRRNPHPP